MNNGKVNITGNGIEITDAIRDITIKKAEILINHNTDIQSINVIFDKENHDWVAKATLTLPRQPTIHAHETTSDLYKSIDGMMHKLLVQINKIKR